MTSRFEMALQTMTATHQLKTALTSVAFAGRAIFLVSTFAQTDKCDTADVSLALIRNSLSNALLGIDANDPPKTLASMQLICSIYSSLTIIGSSDSEPVFQQVISLSEWLDCFFSRLFSLLHYAESTGVINDVLPSLTMEETFLIEDDPYYFCMLEILLGKLSEVLFNQSLEKISKLVKTNILPGATKEVGLLCCASIKSKPEEAAAYLIKPILETITSSLRGTPISGLWGSTSSDTSLFAKAALSPTLEIVTGTKRSNYTCISGSFVEGLYYFVSLLVPLLNHGDAQKITRPEEMKHLISPQNGIFLVKMSSLLQMHS